MNSYEKLQKFKIDSMVLNYSGCCWKGCRAMKAQKVDLTTNELRDTRSFELAYVTPGYSGLRPGYSGHGVPSSYNFCPLGPTII